ncbi:hypothetical protein THOM_2002 [Trachipleistophora hominis]|uniref:Uncharacterized protein n=1 Tax=Trachipleistophora hominis TaxID=72359 RepID=L7JUB8_TRAHO|nr:hypothetical protein THOM_2002 [Trachipleistophora hominis]
MLKKLNKIRNRVYLRGGNPENYINAIKSLKKQDESNKEIYNAEIAIHRFDQSKSMEAKHRFMRKVRCKIPKLNDINPLYARYAEILSLFHTGDEKGNELLCTIADEIYEYDAFYTNLLKAREQGLKREIKDFSVLKYGITIKFNTETEKKYFLSHVLLRGDNFDVNLANYVTRLDKMKTKVIKSMGKVRSFPLKRAKIVDMKQLLQTFCAFLEQNYVEHENVKKLLNEVLRVEAFIEEIVYRIKFGRRNCDISDLNLECFPELNPYIIRDVKLFDNEAFTTKALIMDEVARSFEKKEILPFLPIFYDIAYDHIQFPEIDDDNS